MSSSSLNAPPSSPLQTTSTPVKGWGWSDLIALGIWTIALLVLFREPLLFGKAFFYFDVTEINYPYRDFLAKEWSEGRFSRWHPGLYCGMPLYSESQAGYLHPLKPFLYPWLPTWQAFNLDVILSIWLTGVGTYGWLRRRLGSPASLTGAAVFGLGGYMWAHFVHTSMINALASVPFLVWAIESSWASGRLRGASLGGLILAFQVFAGHLQDVLLTVLALMIYGCYQAIQDRERRLFVLGSTLWLVTLGVALAAVQWIPSKELLDRSPRSEGLTWKEITYGSWHPELLPTLVFREAYGTRARDTDWMDGFYPYHEMNCYLGALVIGLAVLGCARYRDRWVGFWILLAFIAGLLMLGKHTFLFDFISKIPVLGSSRIPVRYDLWLSLAMSALAAVGVERLVRETNVSLKSALWTIGLIIIASVPIVVTIYWPVWSLNGPKWTLPYHIDRFRWLGEDWLLGGLRTLAFLAVGFVAIVKIQKSRQGTRILGWALPVLILADLIGAHWYDAPTIDPKYWTTPPPAAQRLLNDPTTNRVFGIASKASSGEPGYASTRIDFFAKRDPLAWSLPPVWGLKTNNGETPIIPARKKQFTDIGHKAGWGFAIEGVSHLVTDARNDGEPAGAATVLRLLPPLDRIRLVSQVVYANNANEAAERLQTLGEACRNQAVIEDPNRPLPEGQETQVNGTVQIGQEIPEHIVIQAKTDQPAYLILADAYDPGWSATINGQPTPIQPAYIAFRAIFLPKGEHEIILKYQPAGFTLGVTITGIALPIFLGGLLWSKRWTTISAQSEPSRWPPWWLWLLPSIAIILIITSTFGVRDGHLAIQSRWDESFHSFTWDSGIEAMGKVGVGR